jgi:curved DNA-binding protein CbpA
VNNRKSFDYYLTILGVTFNSTKEEIRRAYYQLIKQWHPDKFPNDQQRNIEATEKSKLINDAYHNLKDFLPLSRNEYVEKIIVNSSNIHSIQYDKIKMILRIEFRKGGIYEYQQVPESICRELLNSKSKGKYANSRIYNSYHCERVG